MLANDARYNTAAPAGFSIYFFVFGDVFVFADAGFFMTCKTFMTAFFVFADAGFFCRVTLFVSLSAGQRKARCGKNSIGFAGPARCGKNSIGFSWRTLRAQISTSKLTLSPIEGAAPRSMATRSRGTLIVNHPLSSVIVPSPLPLHPVTVPNHCAGSTISFCMMVVNSGD
jgi:hypothetical protein